MKWSSSKKISFVVTEKFNVKRYISSLYDMQNTIWGDK